MHISVIIPAYNAERFLEETVNSVLAQTHSDWDLVIVDNGSIDGTALIANRMAALDGRIRLETRSANEGAAAARNFALLQAPPSDAVAFLDADDVWLTGMLERLTRALQESPSAVAACGTVQHVDADTRPLQSPALVTGEERWTAGRFAIPRRLDSKDPTDFPALATWCSIRSPGAVLVRRDRFDAEGGFDPSAGHCADWDLWLRLARRGPFVFVNEPVLLYRWHDQNMSHDHVALAKSAEYVLHKAARSSDNDSGQSRSLRRGYRARHAVLARSKLPAAWENLRRKEFASAGRQLGYGAGHAARMVVGLR